MCGQDRSEIEMESEWTDDDQHSSIRGMYAAPDRTCYQKRGILVLPAHA
jgi:hypothetical protein